jgi:phosphoribosylformylglycinamidine synthase
VVLPIAHAEGRWHADEQTLARIEGEGQVVMRYAGGAPNGATHDVAAVCNARGNVLGMMPHPERHAEAALGGVDGARMFRALAEVLG